MDLEGNGRGLFLDIFRNLMDEKEGSQIYQ
jgi:hypothetical protein